MSATTSPFPKSCGCCGRVCWTAERLERFAFVGVQDDGDDGHLSLRNCPCGSTFSVPAEYDPKAARIVFLTLAAVQAENELLRAKLGLAATEPPPIPEVEGLPESIAMARAAREAGVSMQAARRVLASLSPDEAASIARLAGEEAARGRAEDAERQARRARHSSHVSAYARAARNVESDCDQSRASCPKADPASEGDDETDIIIAGRQVPFVQVGMIVHPDDCLNCARDGSPLCSALVCDIHDDDETARFGMMATLLFRNGERREEPCDELRRRWRLARDFDQGRVYTGRWGTIPRGSVWPVAEVNEDA